MDQKRKAERPATSERAREFSRAARRLVIKPGPGAATLQAQVFQGLRSLIAQGALPPGDRLPSTRRLAEDLEVSRNTVVAAFEQLAADGWVESRQGSGSFVSRDLPTSEPPPKRMTPSPAEGEHHPFLVGVPGLDLFPLAVWGRLQAKRWAGMGRSALQEGDSAGWSGLRHAIAAHLSMSRGLNYAPEQVIVTNSARGAIFLAARVLLERGEEAWAEDPGYFGCKDALRAGGARVVMVPVDAAGLCVEEGMRLAPGARLAVVTPQCQFPTTVVMSPERRSQLLTWAREASAWVIEDAYDSEITFGATRSVSMLEDGGGDRVILLNSFNKILFPALRVGYMVVPENLVDAFSRARRVIDGHSNTPNQMILRDFIEGGHFDDHVRRCREAYGERRAVLLAALREHLGEHFDVDAQNGGLHLVPQVKPPLDPRTIVRRAGEAGIEMTAVSELLDREVPERRLMLGYSGFTVTALRRAAARLGRVCDDLAREP